MSLIDTLKTAFKEREEQRVGDFQSLAVAVLDGVDVSSEEACAVLEAAGKTADDLQAEVARLRKRRVRQSRLSDVPKIEGSREQLESEIRDANTAFAKQQTKWQNAVGERTAKIRQLESDHANAMRARRELIAGCDDPALLQEADVVEAELKRLETTKRSAQAVLENSRRQLRTIEYRSQHGYEGNKQTAADQLPEAAKQVGDAKQRLAEIQKQLDDLIQRQNENVEAKIWA